MYVLGNPHSIFWALAYAYIFMNLAMLFSAMVFAGNRLENRIRLLFILNGISGIVTLASAFLDSPPVLFTWQPGHLVPNFHSRSDFCGSVIQ